MRNYYVGLATVKPTALSIYRKKYASRGIPLIAAGFATDENPIQADLLLRYAIERGDFADALAHIIGCGMGRHERPFPTTVGGTIAPSDLWAVVCYDAAPVGLRMPPSVLFGDGRHVVSLTLSLPMYVDTQYPAENSRQCGFIPHTHVPIATTALFTFMSVSADLRF